MSWDIYIVNKKLIKNSKKLNKNAWQIPFFMISYQNVVYTHMQCFDHPTRVEWSFVKLSKWVSFHIDETRAYLPLVNELTAEIKAARAKISCVTSEMVSPSHWRKVMSAFSFHFSSLPLFLRNNRDMGKFFKTSGYATI